MNLENSDEYWMEFAMQEAEIAFRNDEVPVGAIIVKDNKIIASSHNATQKLNSSLAHAEKLTIETAQKKIGKWLYGCELFVTLEPCAMCAGMIILSRLDALIFGAHDPKNGATGSVYNILSDRRFNHNPEVRSGLLADRSSNLLKKFFRNKRKNKL